MTKLLRVGAGLMLAGLLLGAAPARAALEILACEPEWAALAQELGGERVKTSSATTAAQDPHRVQARPSLLAKARKADLLVCTGAELEVGWLPVLLRETGNARIQPGQPGYFEAAGYVALLEKPARLDRAEGDVHPEGNPHIQTDPRNIGRVAAVLANRLGQLDPQGAAYYAARQAVFERRWNGALARWSRQAEPLRGMPVVSQHKAFAYLYQWLGLREVAVLEPKPGLEASAAHVAGVLNGLRAQPAKAVLRADYEASRASDFVGARAGIPVIALPMSVAEPGDAGAALEAWFERLVGLLLSVPR